MGYYRGIMDKEMGDHEGWLAHHSPWGSHKLSIVASGHFF